MRTDDGHIIRECLNGDSASFGLLVDKYKAGIFALALSILHDFHDAEDITQEVFIKAYKCLKTLKRWDSFVIWLRSTTINLCKDKLREQSRHRDVPINEQTPKVIENASLDSYRDEQSSSWRNEALDSMNKALSSLPEQYQQVLTLHYLGGMSGEEISKFLSVSHATVRQRLSRAREHLKAEVLAMMGETFEQQRLQATFTFRIVEMVKRIKINPVSTIKNLPWGLSLATGIIIAVMSFNPIMISFNHIGTPIYSPLPVESKILKVGEIPVDVVKTSNIAILSSKIGKGNGGEPKKPDMQNALSMAPQGKGGTWTTKASMPTARISFPTSVVDGIIYAIGGCKGWGDALSVVEAYNPSTNIWTKKANMSTPRSWFYTATVKRKIYAFGGWDGSHTISTVEAYDPATNIWTRKADMPTERALASTAVVNDIIYVIGGSADTVHSISTVEAYDPATDTWSKKVDMPTARWGVVAAPNADGNIYAIGGEMDNSTPSYAVEVYDPTTDTWTKPVFNTC